MGAFTELWYTLTCRGGAASRKAREERDMQRKFSDVILLGEVKERVEGLGRSIRNARRHKAPFRHLMLYGPPGTGKTMCAKRLALCSGLDYAIMSGGDVGPLGSDAVTQLHSIFTWANASPNGLLLFIDEAEAFLASRSKANMSEAQRNALNALLYQTGEQSYNFMMVLATNRPGDLDAAVNDRVDEALSFDLPGLAERESMCWLYFSKFITRKSVLSRSAAATKPKASGKVSIADRMGGFYASIASIFSAVINFLTFSNVQPIMLAPDLALEEPDSSAANAQLIAGAGLEAAISGIAKEVTGFSGREIAKLMISVQGAAYGSPDGMLSKELLQRVVRWKVEEHHKKDSMRKKTML
jgi:ATPase family AAA domain-containing protein 3A/B